MPGRSRACLSCGLHLLGYNFCAMAISSNHPRPSEQKKLVAALQDNWLNEYAIAIVYRRIAAMERDEKRKSLLMRMAVNEEEHAKLWEERLADLGERVDPSRATDEIEQRERHSRLFGTMAAIRKIEREERGHVGNYSGQLDTLGDERTSEILRRIIPDEQEHAERLQIMGDSALIHSSPKSALEHMLARDKWHRNQTGGWMGDAIYGVNDGLGAVFGIVSGMAGATQHAANGSHIVLLAGLAGMMASALSMGSGAYLATKSEKEVRDAEIDRERREIEMDPEHEREELELMYQLKGFSEDESKLLSARMTSDPEHFLQTMASEELGIAMVDEPKPLVSALSAAVATAIGAFIPIIPFFFMSGLGAIVTSFVISIVAHFAVGASKTVITGRSWLGSGMEMTVVGVVEAAITYGLGLLIGGNVGG